MSHFPYCMAAKNVAFCFINLNIKLRGAKYFASLKTMDFNDNFFLYKMILYLLLFSQIG